MLVPVGVALGSNLGDRQAELDAGIGFLRGLAADGTARESTRLETAPVNCPPGSGDFLNAVVEIVLDSETLPPALLLERLQAFEKTRGRTRQSGRNAPRPLDLDIIYYGNAVVRTAGLTIPHPRIAERLFVLKPLASLRPDLVLPGQEQSISERLAALTRGNGASGNPSRPD